MNNLKIITQDEKAKVFIDDKEIKYIKSLKLNLSADELRNVEIKFIVNNVDIDTDIDEIIEKSEDNSNE